MPSQMPTTPQAKCKKKHETVLASVTIDEKGKPGQVNLLTVTGTVADQLAMEIIRNDSFIPAQQGGSPVSVNRVIQLDMDACTAKMKDNDGEKREQGWLLSLPVQTIQPLPASMSAASDTPIYRVGGHISAPIPLLWPEVEFSDEARRAHYEGQCIISLIVDANGMPQNPRVVKPLGKGLDEQALNAVRKYRFRPAMKDGKEPVPVMISVSINFRLG